MAGAEDLEGLAEDWISLWQSEIAGMAADRETAEAWAAYAAMAAAWMRAAAAGPAHRPPQGMPPALLAWLSAWPGVAGMAWPPAAGTPAHDGAAPPPGPAAPADASEPGGNAGPHGDARGADAAGVGGTGGAGEREQALLDRLAELERRLADLEGGQGGGRADPPRPGRRRPRL